MKLSTCLESFTICFWCFIFIYVILNIIRVFFTWFLYYFASHIQPTYSGEMFTILCPCSNLLCMASLCPQLLQILSLSQTPLIVKGKYRFCIQLVYVENSSKEYKFLSQLPSTFFACSSYLCHHDNFAPWALIELKEQSSLQHSSNFKLLHFINQYYFE